MPIGEHEIVWRMTATAAAHVRRARDEMGEELYRDSRAAFRELMTQYINAVPGCSAKQGKTISPMGSTPGGRKAFKVRFAVPGCGRSGGFRLAVACDCGHRDVLIAAAWMRADDPADAEFDIAFGR